MTTAILTRTTQPARKMIKPVPRPLPVPEAVAPLPTFGETFQPGVAVITGRRDHVATANFRPTLTPEQAQAEAPFNDPWGEAI